MGDGDGSLGASLGFGRLGRRIGTTIARTRALSPVRSRVRLCVKWRAEMDGRLGCREGDAGVASPPDAVGLFAVGEDGASPPPSSLLCVSRVRFKKKKKKKKEPQKSHSTEKIWSPNLSEVRPPLEEGTWSTSLAQVAQISSSPIRIECRTSKCSSHATHCAAEQ